jgi:uncharacterized protein YndB with AHSA1/START domain
MATTPRQKADASRTDLAITRVIDAPRALVFEAWTKSQHFKRWFGPRDIDVPFCEMDVRPGGKIRFCHRSEDGISLWLKGTFQEVVASERLVFTLGFVDDDGRPAAPSFVPDWPLEAQIVTTVVFADEKGKTRLTIGQVITPASLAGAKPVRTERELASKGWTETLDRLEEHLADRSNGSFDLVLTRIVAAPRSLIWKAWTTPEHLVKWWAPKPITTPECEMDVRPGGLFRTLMRAPDGKEYPTQGCFLDVVENERLVFTDALQAGWRPSRQPFFTAIITLEDVAGGTRYTATAMHKDDADREKHEAMGFSQGWGKCLDQLVALVGGMQETRR